MHWRTARSAKRLSAKPSKGDRASSDPAAVPRVWGLVRPPEAHNATSVSSTVRDFNIGAEPLRVVPIGRNQRGSRSWAPSLSSKEGEKSQG
jgi:hypothetical protein